MSHLLQLFLFLLSSVTLWNYLTVNSKCAQLHHLDTCAKIWTSPLLFLLSVFRNGDLLCPPFRFILPRSMQQDLEQILSLVTEKVSLRTGAVRRSATPTHIYTLCGIPKESETSSKHLSNPASSGCALWKGWLCPPLQSWRLATAMLPWEQRGLKNFHMWSCWLQKLLRGIVMQGFLSVSFYLLLLCLFSFIK